jgi:hypothetical protein
MNDNTLLYKNLMKKHLFALALFAATGLASAQSSSAATVRAYTVEIGALTHSELYEEFTPAGGKIMQEDASMQGLRVNVTRHIDAASEVTVGLEYARGKAEYTGAYMGGNYGDLQVGGLSRQLFDVTGAYGFRFHEMPDTTFSAGMGYRRLVDNLQEAGAGGYKRVNNLIYATLGVEHAFKGQAWTISPGLRHKHLLRGDQFSDLLGGITVDQKGGSGSEVYVSFAHQSGLVLTPYVRLWSIKDSEVSPQGLNEPRNKTREIGIQAAWRF